MQSLDELAATLIARLRAEQATLGVAESLTGGLLAATLVNVPGASEVFRGGIVSYATDVKSDLLGVDKNLLAARGAVDAQVAKEMALGATRQLKADFAISTTGIAGPDSVEGKPVGLVYLGFASAPQVNGQCEVLGREPADSWSVKALQKNFSGDRLTVRKLTVTAALEAFLVEFSGERGER